MDAEFLDWADQVIAVFDGVLDKAESSYSAVFLGLDALVLKPQPTAADVKWLEQRVPNTLLARGYFFEHLENPEWLDLLAEAGVLAQVSPLERNEEEGTIGFPPWPPRSYLLKMAKAGDGEIRVRVRDVLVSLPDTDNTAVHSDAAEIALSLPPELAKDIAAYVQRGLLEPFHLLLPHRAADLLQYLAKNGQKVEALALAQTLFEVLPDPGPPRAMGDLVFPPTPRPRIQPVFYKQELRKCMSALLEEDPWTTAQVLIDLVENAVRLSQRDGGDGRHSHSHAWQPSLVGRSGLDEPRELLLQALVDAALLACERAPHRLQEMIGLLEGRQWLVFERIVLHLLATVGEDGAELADARLANLDSHEDPELHAEYLELLQDRFPDLGREKQAAILEHLTAEREFAEQKERLEGWLGHAVTDDEVRKDIRRRKYLRLKPLEEFLTSPLKETFAAWESEFNPEEPPEIEGPGWGNRSPKSTTDLLALPDEDMVAYLKVAEFGHNPMGPSMEGLGDALAGAAEGAPERLSRLAAQLDGLDPSLVLGLLRGLESAAKLHKTIVWAEVLRLSQWVVGQPRAIPGRVTRHSDLDPGWVWTRRQIASLLLQGLQEAPSEIEVALRPEVWRVLSELLTDPDPDPTDPPDDDPLNAALQSVRGEAIRAAMVYGLWVRRHNPAETTLDSTPELRSALEVHLDPGTDPAPQVRAVFGDLLRLLFHLDPDWVRANIRRIFPSEPQHASLRLAAWDGFVRSRGPFAPLLKELDPEYRHAIGVEESAGASRNADSAAQRTSEHIVILEWQGLTNIDDPEGLSRWFFEHASPELRGHAMEFVGRALTNTKGDPPADCLERLRHLWGWRMSCFREEAVAVVAEEAEAFGWWFAATKFPADWSLQNLRDVLALGVGIDWEHRVIETLAELSVEHPVLAVECLDLLLRYEGQRWGLDLSLEAIQKVVTQAVRSADPTALRIARSVVNRLESIGHHGFRGLLS